MSLWCGMMTPPVQLERIAHIFSEWAEPLPLERVFVFGSYARGDATAKSDLDVAIKFDEQNLTHERSDAWLRENNRRTSNKEQVERVTGLALKRKPPVDFCGYWQRHVKQNG
jgi:predicted nucleotidyltransferase